MRDDSVPTSPHRLWAEFRYSVIGHLLAAPPCDGELAGEIKQLVAKEWRHPLSGKPLRLGFSTIEGWYYVAKKEKCDPLSKLRSKARKDIGKSRSFTAPFADFLTKQYGEHPSWSYRLHADNLCKAGLGQAPSYPSVQRYMKAHNLHKQRKVRRDATANAINRVASREVRSYEVEHVNALWHLDYHHSSLKVVEPNGLWYTPVLLGIFDDHSRLACHMQWYIFETTENLVHGFSQALLKREIPRALLNDNGSQMTSDEFLSGLKRLSIIIKNTLPESPYQNGKCEHVWTKVEGRLMAMLDNYKDLSLKFLNDTTQAWVEMEYNRAVHTETGQSPIDRYVKGKSVGRSTPNPEALRMAFRREIKRTVRRSDGTIVLKGQRFEIPSRFRNLDKVIVKYATWDLSYVHLVDFRTGDEISPLYPVDKAKNSDGLRRTVENPVLVERPTPTTEIPPLLSSLIAEYQDAGLKPAYIPKSETSRKQQ